MQKGMFVTSSLLSGAQTVTTTGAAVQVGSFTSVVVYLNATAVTGTTPSMTVTLQDSPDGVTWYNIASGAFNALTAAGSQRLVVTNVGYFIRAIATISGTTPSFTVDLQCVGN